jgi:hypothetical protein
MEEFEQETELEPFSLRFVDFPIQSRYMYLEPEIRLWRAVLDQALSDLLNGRALEETLDWFNRDIEEGEFADGFEEVCELARISPVMAQEYMFGVLERAKVVDSHSPLTHPPTKD